MSDLVTQRHALTSITKADESAGGGEFAGLLQAPPGDPGAKNWAEDVAVREWVQNQLCPLVSQTRYARASLEQEWNAIRAMAAMKHDEGRKYRGKSEVYLPIWARNEDTLVTTIARGLFPSDDFLDCSDETPGAPPESSKPLKAYMEWEIRHVAKLQTHMRAWIRQLMRYGTSPLKVLYAKEMRYEGRRKKGLLRGIPAVPDFKKRSYEGLRVSVRSLFNWYIYPMTVEKIDDAVLVFEDIQTPRQVLEAFIRAGRWREPENARNAPVEPQQQSNEMQQFDMNNLVSPTTQLQGNELGDVRTITECWLDMELPAAAYYEDEEPGCPVPCRVTLAGSEVLEVTRNPFWHQRKPYLGMTLSDEPGLFYGAGPGRKVRQLQYLVNDFANQTNDNGMYALNPIVKYNPAMIAGPLRPLRPGVMWPMHDVQQGVAFDRPPGDHIQYGLQLLQLWTSMAQDASGAPPVLQGNEAAKTATGTQVLQRNALSPLQDMVEDIENQVMVPLLDMAWVNAQQYRDQDVIAYVAGQAIQVTLDDLAIDAKFRWMASNQAANQAQRAQALVQFLQIVMAGPALQMLMQQGKVLDVAYILGRLWSDGFGFRGWDKAVVPMPMQAMGPQVPGAPGVPGAPPDAASPGDRARSTVEQDPTTGGLNTGMDAAPGEAEDFMGVRQQADDMAAALGSTYGGGQ